LKVVLRKYCDLINPHETIGEDKLNHHVEDFL